MRRHFLAKNSSSSSASHPPSVYRREGHDTPIEIRLREVRQLFHTLDPAPFREKDLDDDAERYLLEACQEAGARHKLRLVVYLPASEAANDAAHTLPDAVHNYFAYRERELRLDLIRLLRYGAVCLGIGVAFLMACLGLRRAGRTHAGLRQSDRGRGYAHSRLGGHVASDRGPALWLVAARPPASPLATPFFGYSGRGSRNGLRRIPRRRGVLINFWRHDSSCG